MNLQVGVKICLFNTDNQLLLVQRSGKYKDIEGQWDLVGGRIEPGIPLTANLKREIEEETGIIYTGTPKLIFAQDILGNEKHVVRLTYAGKVKTIQLKSSDDEWTNIKWFSLKDLSKLKTLDKYLREVLENFSYSLEALIGSSL